MIVLSKLNELYFKLNCDKETAKLVQKHFEFYAENYMFSPKYQESQILKNAKYGQVEIKGSQKAKDLIAKLENDGLISYTQDKLHYELTMKGESYVNSGRLWNGKISLIKLTDYKLPIGLFGRFRQFCLDNKIPYEFDFNPKMVKNHSEEFFEEFYNTVFSDGKFYPRGYQHDAIKSAINKKRGLIEHATGSGKSADIYCIIRYLLAINKRICLIVPSVMLVEQMRKEFIEYGWEEVDDYLTIQYQDHEPDITRPVLISTFQSLYTCDESIIKSYTAVIVDESHMAKAKTIKEILSKMVYADYRIGLSATLPDQSPAKLGELLTIEAFLGPIISTKPAHELIEEGYLSSLKIINLILKYPKELCEVKRSYKEEVEFINSFSSRNKFLDVIFSNIDKNQNSLVLVEELDHLESLYQHIESKFSHRFSVFKISGEIKAKKRLEIQNLSENRGGVIITATLGTMSTGVNIRRIHNVITASSSKAKTRVLQLIGRGLRLHESKQELLVWNAVDDLRYKNTDGSIHKNYTWKHFEQRLEHYKIQKYPWINKNLNLFNK